MIVFLSTSLCYADDIDTSGDFEFTSAEVVSIDTDTPDINSRAAVILEKSTGTILFGKNENDIRKMASTTKIMTAIIILESEKYNPQAKITMTREILDLVLGTGSAVSNLQEGEIFSQKDLMYLILMSSAGDCTYLAAQYFGGSVDNFVNLMNQKATE